MPKFLIRYGLGGGFTWMEDREEIEAGSLGEAENYAFEQACQVYESYEGMYGIPTYDDIKKEHPEWDDEDIEMAWMEERESWIAYAAKPK